MYSFYLHNVLLPIAPGKLDMKFKSRNETIELLNDSEVSVLKNPSLISISFELILPNTQYPFALYKDGFKRADYYIDKFNKFKTDKKPIQFIVIRTLPNGTPIFNTNIKVSFEDYAMSESASDGFDVTVSVNLQQYKEYGTKKVKIEKVKVEEQETKVEVKEERVKEPAIIGIGSDVIVNGRLHRDSYGSRPGQTRTEYKGKVNLINEKGSHPYHITTPEGSWLGWVTKESVRGI